MEKVYLSLLSLLTVSAFADPAVSNIRASQRENTKLVDILYDVSYSGGSNVSVTCEVSTNSGTSYDVPSKSFSGTGYGAIVTTGNDRLITWNAGIDWNEEYSEQMKVRITAKAPRFTDNGDGTITDNKTGLMWQKSPSNIHRTWIEANSFCFSLGDGWRLPTSTEFYYGLRDASRTPKLPAGHPFINISGGLHWTADTIESLYRCSIWILCFLFLCLF
jgi:Protein of unknown function (DUF1566)